MSTFPFRSEILFLYDVFRCNPNGDPFENKPRQDPITKKIEVTDVRLKRTIRDYLKLYKKKSIFVEVPRRAIVAQERYETIFRELLKVEKEEEAEKKLIKECVDVRMFGALVPILKKKGEEVGGAIHLTGAVQFNMGQSLHAAELEEIRGTGGFASREEARQKTFRTEYIVPYALIGFYGTINEHLAEKSCLTEEDVGLLMEAMWNGTLALHSRSKAFHHPRLLVRIDYKEERQCGYFLDKILLRSKVEEKNIRSPKDYKLDLQPWFDELSVLKQYIKRVYYRSDPDLSLLKKDKPLDLRSEFENLVGREGQIIEGS